MGFRRKGLLATPPSLAVSPAGRPFSPVVVPYPNCTKHPRSKMVRGRDLNGPPRVDLEETYLLPKILGLDHLLPHQSLELARGLGRMAGKVIVHVPDCLL